MTRPIRWWHRRTLRHRALQHRKERISDAIRQLAHEDELRRELDTEQAGRIRAEAELDNTVTQLLHTIARLEGVDYPTARLEHLGDS